MRDGFKQEVFDGRGDWDTMLTISAIPKRQETPPGRKKASNVSNMNYKIPLVLAPQPEGGYTVTSPTLNLAPLQ